MLVSIKLWPNLLDHYTVGIGSSLVERAISYSSVSGFGQIDLWCIEGNTPAQRAYEKLGFSQSGQIKMKDKRFNREGWRQLATTGSS